MFYVGSTVQPLSKRMEWHKGKYRKYVKGEYTYITVFTIFDEYDVQIVKYN